MTCWQLISSGAPLLKFKLLYIFASVFSFTLYILQKLSGVFFISGKRTIGTSDCRFVIWLVERNRCLLVAGDVEAELNHYTCQRSQKYMISSLTIPNAAICVATSIKYT